MIPPGREEPITQSATVTSIETAARTDGAPLVALRKLDKRFGATHALKAVDLTFEEGEIHAIVGENGAGKSTLIKLLDRRLSALVGRSVLARRAGRARDAARGDQPWHQRGSPGGRAVPPPHCRRQYLSRRRGDARRPPRPQADGARRSDVARRPRIRFAGRSAAVVADHRPTAAGRDRTRRTARGEIPHLRRADRLPHPPGNGGLVQADPPAKGERRHDCLHQPPSRRGV